MTIPPDLQGALRADFHPFQGVLTDLVGILRGKCKGLRAVYLYGSFGTKWERSDSDVDLAILLMRPLSVQQLWDLSSGLASRLGRDVDLIDLLSASVVMRFEAVEKGRCLYSDGSYEVREFESRVFSDYVRWNERRAPLIEAIRKRGHVYAR